MRFKRNEPQRHERSAIARFLAACETERHRLHSVMIVKNGGAIFERWWEPYATNLRHKLYSLSKSFTSLAIGIAIDEGLLTTDTLLSDIFTNEFAQLDVPERTRRMTIRHLLTMNSGHSFEAWSTSEDINNIERFLTAEVEFEPGTQFFYNTLGTYMLSAALTRLTGQTLETWLRPRLFEPLGIDAYWENDSQTGVSLGGVGLNVRTEDLAALGQLLLDKGEWRGKRIVSASYIETATSKLTESVHGDSIDWRLGYGYQFWQCQREGVYRGDGMFGQYVVVEPSSRTVIAITGNANMGRVMELLWQLLADMGDASLPNIEMPPERSLLNFKPENRPYPQFNAAYRVEKLNENSRLPLTELSFNFSTPGECLLLMYAGGSTAALPLLLREGEWYYTAVPYIPDSFFGSSSGYYGRAYVAGEWHADETFTAKVWFNETPCLDEWRFAFNSDRSEVEIFYRGFSYNSRFERVGSAVKLS